jgi:cytochrome c oxidase subunit II
MKRTWIPALVLIGSAFLLAPPAPPARAEGEARTVEVTAKRFEFTPASLTLKRGEPVRLLVRSEDVTHGFFQRALKIDTDLEPGKTAEVLVTPREAGTYTIICHHFCGAQHGNMKMTVVVE